MSYADRPWLTRYPAGSPADIEAEYTTALDVFDAAVAAEPDSPFLYYFDATLTFADVDRAATALASALVGDGFSAGDRLAVYVQNNPAFIIGIVAAWKAGGIAVAINPMNKQRELTYMLVDSGATALLTLDDLYDDVAAPVIATGKTAVRTVFTTSPLDFQTRDDPRLFAGVERRRNPGTRDLVETIDGFDGSSLPAPTLTADDVAVLTYTSGTTGEPKGAMNTHGNLAFNAQTYRDWTGLKPGEGVLGVAPLFHITGLVGHVMIAMLVRAPLTLTHRFAPDVTLDAIRERRPVFTVAAITAFNALSAAPGATPADFESLRILYSGGAPIAPAMADRLEQVFGAYIHNIYGLTETSSPSHGVPLGVRAPVDATSGALSVGVPVFNTVVRVVGEDGEDLPVGEVGEFVTSGPQVVKGYWNKPDKTAESIPGGALKTGDVGFMDSDGWFYVVDRKKDMINASGYKVWPREVEDVLYTHPAVREAAVIGVPDEYRGETVKAYVSLQDGATVDTAELVEFCKEQMAAYKYPREVEIVCELPKTVTGKILRRELRDAG
ncbi:AMP-binding protein [Gordonia sp. Z-3]|uniref:AMP-binding protein n=1 Tax=unclassified Gordonia (in: high G+C Gram-positive bacteria) TaxID=2657482 RepID=UPI000C69025D|nr:MULTISPECIES: AMP-binding protein [unclassified Gordonia (in: high G+C Gram-positive bacteria)]MAU82571.1 acyl-CoA synthetase [Gordonia sp. (in: high G+C Gram-positive bacteria)]MDY6808945.1 AMP-binding protein [Actinomycetota bacterium]MED5803256.1 AMP-binding protein [Gordonia sp. Z-3]